MKTARTFSVADARKHFARVLSLVENGVPVVIQRRGFKFRVELDRNEPKPRKRASLVEILDPAIESGTWSWEWRGGAVSLEARKGAASKRRRAA